MLITGITGFKR